MDKKLAGWKANSLSLAGRVTLASSVLNAIPSYVMQSAFLPVHICEAIDRKIRDFIWGSVDGARKIHNINWETVCKPKHLGGLGLRNARDLNKAFLMKIVWGLVTRPTELWAKVLRSKYLKNTGNDVVMQVVGMSPPVERLGKDALVWGLEADGRFSIRSAYLMFSDDDTSRSEPFWWHIWGWKGPSKIKHFLWLASHNRLLTNEERGRRHLTNQVLCHRCSSHTESISHVIYECDFSMQVWRNVFPSMIEARAAYRDFGSWWKAMLMDKDSNIKFGIIALNLWKARNRLIFEGANQSSIELSEQCKYWINLVLSSWKTCQLGREAPGLARQTQLVAWRPGDEGWFILNTDGSRYTHSGSTAIGGLIRNDQGKFVHAFTANLGDCSITRAEICAIVQGMKLAWDLGIRKLLIQSDSTAAVAILLRDDTNHQHAILALEFQELKSRSWDITITHVFREANCGADYLANLGHSYCFGFHLFSQPNSTLAHWLRFDLIGVASPRVISNY
ncbi:Putative ribonuclease H protein At1g65750 [Linum perenne]